LTGVSDDLIDTGWYRHDRSWWCVFTACTQWRRPDSPHCSWFL